MRLITVAINIKVFIPKSPFHGYSHVRKSLKHSTSFLRRIIRKPSNGSLSTGEGAAVFVYRSPEYYTTFWHILSMVLSKEIKETTSILRYSSFHRVPLHIPLTLAYPDTRVAKGLLSGLSKPEKVHEGKDKNMGCFCNIFENNEWIWILILLLILFCGCCN